MAHIIWAILNILYNIDESSTSKVFDHSQGTTRHTRSESPLLINYREMV